MLGKSLGSLALKGLSQVSRFLLVFFLARALSAEELGVFGLMAVSVTLSIYLIGLDFYVFNIRQLLASDAKPAALLVRDQLAFQAVAYLCLLPLLAGVFVAGVLPWRLCGWFFGLVVLDHLAQEAYRLLTTLSRPVVANLVFFLRNGLWAWVVIVATLTGHAFDLDLLWASWLGGLVGSVLLAGVALRDLGWRAARGRSVDWRWVREGVRVALPFFAGTVCLRAMELGDRFFLDAFWGKAEVGVFTFYASIANALRTAIDTGVVMILYPGVIAAFQAGDRALYRTRLRQMGVYILAAVLVGTALAGGGIFVVLHLLDRPVYAASLPAYWFLLGAAGCSSLAAWPHYALFAHRRDRAILASTAVALLVLALVDLALVPTWGVLGAGIGATSGAAVLLLGKAAFAIRAGPPPTGGPPWRAGDDGVQSTGDRP